MQKLIAIIVCWCLVLQVFAQQNIIKAEYFIDNDPGFGNATNISISPSANIINNTFSIPSSVLTRGVHTLFIRSEDANGKWSVTSAHVFYNFGLPLNIVYAEYFLDTDPGFGNAINIPLTPATNINSNTFSIPMNPLILGLHTLFIRSKDIEGKWSLTNSHVFYNFGSAIINKVEYFIDTDPGFGNATNIPVTPSSNISLATFAIPISSFSQGFHALFLRSQDADGKWSISNQRGFFNFGSPDTLEKITRLEYFIDTDPGFGNATPVTFNYSTNISDLIAQVNITGLSAGTHQFYVRSRTATKWSITNEYDFPIASTASSPYININSSSKKVMCAGDNFRLSFDASGNYNAGNVFTAQLSDENGSFSSPISIGQVTGIVSTQELTCSIPSHRNEGTNYRVRMVSSNPVVTGALSDTLFTIHDRPYAQTITGRSEVNGTFTWPYSVPNVVTSTFNWLVTGGSFSQTTTNSTNISWIQPIPASVAGKIKIIETNQFGCIGDTSNQNINIYKLRINETVSDLSLCRGEALFVNYSIDGAFDPGDTLTALLSNSAGSFVSPVIIGTKAFSTNGVNQAGIIYSNIPPTTLLGSGYRVRVVSSIPPFTGSVNVSNITVNDCICSKNLSLAGLPSIDSVAITYSAFSNTSAPPAAPYYTNYSPGPATTTTVYRGDRFELSLKVNSPGTYNIAVWVDYNNDNIFAPGENVILSSRTTSVGSDWAQVPIVLSTPNARLRIRVSTDPITANDCCKTLTNGETEDYTISFNQVLNCRWIGRVSTDWHNPVNWSCGIIPDNTKSVMIPAGTPFNCEVLNANASVDRIWIQPGATITVKPGRTLNINGTNATFTW